MIDSAATTSARIVGADVRLVVEIVSPGSARTDRVSKLSEYAEAGIPSYWIVDIRDSVSIDVFILVDGEYELAQQAVGGLITVADPVLMTIDLDSLLPPLA